MPGSKSRYTEEVADKICELIATGSALHKLSKKHDDLPSERTIYYWLETYPEFARKYARARERLADREVDEMIDIADNEADPNKARVRIDVRKWRAAKLAAKKYGDRATHELVGDNDRPIVTLIEFVAPVPRLRDERDRDVIDAEVVG